MTTRPESVGRSVCRSVAEGGRGGVAITPVAKGVAIGVGAGGCRAHATFICIWLHKEVRNVQHQRAMPIRIPNRAP